MFLGTYTPRLDDKGRLILPAKFREQLEAGVVVTRGQERLAVPAHPQGAVDDDRARRAERGRQQRHAPVAQDRHVPGAPVVHCRHLDPDLSLSACPLDPVGP